LNIQHAATTPELGAHLTQLTPRRVASKALVKVLISWPYVTERHTDVFRLL
jgi:hypothetical protein